MSLHVNRQPHYLTVSRDLRATYAFDGEGRLLSAFHNGINYRRGISGEVLLRRFGADGQKQRRLLDQAERLRLFHDIHDQVAQIAQIARHDQPVAVQTWLAQALSWEAQRLEAERARFGVAYKPISILPPDQYLALVVQATEGCSWNRCTFCSFYRDRTFRIKRPDQLQSHLEQLLALFGRGLALRRSVFLGDANALIIPQPRLRELLAVIRRTLPLADHPRLREIYAFLDIFGAEQKSRADYQELHAAGLRRVYLGLESGDPTVFALLNKPGSPAACVEAVRTIKAAGIAVGIILLAGAGGAELAEQHLTGSLDALAAMQLGPGDLIYLSPLLVPPDGPYAERLRSEGRTPLATNAIQEQLARLRAGARAACGPGPNVALYHIEEFVY
ncbi:MAG: radical SAM protein [Oscillochloridaceae bacterium umkhey_bin13]